MALSDGIRALRDRVLRDLDAAHDYYADARVAWRLVQEVVAAGSTFTNLDATTYHRETWQLLRSVADDLTGAALEKLA